MLKKTITYTDFNGDEVTEDHFFYLSKAELIELEVSHDGGLGKWLERVVESQNGKAIMAEFKKLLLSAYGKKSPDGKRFIKNDSIRDEFVSSEAYSELFMQIVTDAEAAAEFVNGIVPAGLDTDMNKLREATKTDKPLKRINRSELSTMSPEVLNDLFASGGIVVDD